MIRITSNLNDVLELNIKRLQNLAQADQLLRTIATSVLGRMKVRVHARGLDSNNEPIGVYSPEYMKVRTGNFFNSSRVSRGINKGSLKDAGVFSKGKKKGTPRPKYNRTADVKVIASLTRQMENDESVFQLSPTAYGIGFTNSDNYDKSQFVEQTYKKKIFSMSPDEEELTIEIVQNFTDNAVSDQNSL